MSVYCYIISLIFFKQSRRESLVVTYALDEVCLASADGFVNGAEALFELGARQVFQLGNFWFHLSK